MNIVRAVREQAGLTQVELSARSGVAQTTISAYESGRRDPGWRVLTALVQAAGLEVVLKSRRPTPEEAGRILYDVMVLAHTIKRSRATD